MNLVLQTKAFEDLIYWAEHDTKILVKILKIFRDIKREPFAGIGKAEPLKYELSGWWSRRIDKEHRLVYKVEKERIIILSCRFHY